MHPLCINDQCIFNWSELDSHDSLSLSLSLAYNFISVWMRFFLSFSLFNTYQLQCIVVKTDFLLCHEWTWNTHSLNWCSVTVILRRFFLLLHANRSCHSAERSKRKITTKIKLVNPRTPNEKYHTQFNYCCCYCRCRCIHRCRSSHCCYFHQVWLIGCFFSIVSTLFNSSSSCTCDQISYCSMPFGSNCVRPSWHYRRL